MKKKIKKYNLMYCSNIFKIDKIKSLIIILNKLIKNLKKKYTSLSLCLSNKLICELNKNKNIKYFKKWLKKKRAKIFSINGFVYKNFHKKYIKYDIHYPDWTTNYRLNYTKNIIKTLNKISSSKTEGSISTSPLSHRKWIKFKHIDFIFFKSLENVFKVFIQLIKIKNKIIHLDFEPEPGCLINNSKLFILYIKKWLTPYLKLYFNKNKILFSKKYITLIKKHIRLCYDTSHFSVNFEKHIKILKNLKKEKIQIGKVQISSALEIKINKSTKLKNILKLKKSPFLHQTVEKKNKNLFFYDDIPDINNLFKKNKNSILRIHCHIPLYKKKYKSFNTTYNETEKTLKFIIKKMKVKYFEIESYTYSCIIGKNEFKSIIKEYNWVKNIIKNL